MSPSPSHFPSPSINTPHTSQASPVTRCFLQHSWMEESSFGITKDGKPQTVTMPTPLTEVVLVPTKSTHGKLMYASVGVNEETTHEQLNTALAINVTNENKVKEVLKNLGLDIGGENGSKGKSRSIFIVRKEEI